MFDASGNPIGGEFVVNTYTTRDQYIAGLAVDQDGNFIVVWQQGIGLGYTDEIHAQRYDASGLRRGGEFVVNTYSTGFEEFAAVSMSPEGSFVVAWTGPGDGSAVGVLARRFDASGNAVGSEFVVNTQTIGYQFSGQVAHDSRGNFIVTWTSRAGLGGPPFHSTFGQRFRRPSRR